MSGDSGVMNGDSKGAGKFLGIALLGGIGVVAAWLTGDPLRFWVNWIYWLMVIITVGLGALFIVAIEHLCGARWSVPLRRAAERLSSLLLLAAPVALIALFSLKVIYPWAQASGPAAHLGGPISEIVVNKKVWLNPTFF